MCTLMSKVEPKQNKRKKEKKKNKKQIAKIS